MNRLEKIANFAKNIHAQNNDGHGFDHITRVVALAEKILLTEPSADRELVLCACYLHDTYDEKLTDNVAGQKALVSNFLDEIFFDKTVKNKIFEIIDNISFSANLIERKTLDINGQIVQDADRLDAMGALGIIRTLEYGWAHGRELYKSTDKAVKNLTKETYHQNTGCTINHFYEKLFLLQDLLNTAEARKIGAKRDKIMHDFVKAIENESNYF
ncbi:HD domain-containing protein [Lactococcus nasutitermitis]|uniref:HD domain-containing protein n=1 Tax=Lactococcus nasutitermitis TaxID=1652957 RepID=A0ABV9JDW6_9LACT|nr:HD domain-containing protein [Lactococcus nasutitermitis]